MVASSPWLHWRSRSGGACARSLGLPGLVERRWEPRLRELEEAIASRPLAEWLELFDGEDVCAGPVSTLAEAAAEFGSGERLGAPPQIGEHTERWRSELGLGGAG